MFVMVPPLAQGPLYRGPKRRTQRAHCCPLPRLGNHDDHHLRKSNQWGRRHQGVKGTLSILQLSRGSPDPSAPAVGADK